MYGDELAHPDRTDKVKGAVVSCTFFIRWHFSRAKSILKVNTFQFYNFLLIIWKKTTLIAVMLQWDCYRAAARFQSDVTD